MFIGSEIECYGTQIITPARNLLANGGTIEEALDAVIEAARREFGIRVIVSVPCQLLVDGGMFTWPDNVQA